MSNYLPTPSLHISDVVLRSKGKGKGKCKGKGNL
jgi:hypothetical protein